MLFCSFKKCIFASNSQTERLFPQDGAARIFFLEVAVQTHVNRVTPTWGHLMDVLPTELPVHHLTKVLTLKGDFTKFLLVGMSDKNFHSSGFEPSTFHPMLADAPTALQQPLLPVLAWSE